MKTRSGFVSNSSSASFVIMLSDLTAEQLKAFSDRVTDIHSILDGTIKLGYLDCKYDAWDVMFWDDRITAGTFCNNDEIWGLFDEIGIPRDKVSLYDDSDEPWEDEDEDQD